MARVRVDGYRKKDGTRVKAHYRDVPDFPGAIPGTISTPEPVRKSSIRSAREQGRAVKAGGVRARARRDRLIAEQKTDAPWSDEGAGPVKKSSPEAVEDFEIRQGVRAREIAALDKAIARDKPQRPRGGLRGRMKGLGEAFKEAGAEALDAFSMGGSQPPITDTWGESEDPVELRKPIEGGPGRVVKGFGGRTGKPKVSGIRKASRRKG